MYARFIKRCLDFLLALLAFLVLLPLLLVLAVVGAIVMGGNPFFTQLRPGRGEKIFKLIKFRSMTNKKGPDGRLLPDSERLVPWGRFLRATSLDELPSLVNILRGDLAVVGPRPQLVRDMVFMTPEQRERHSVRPGLTGLAQCSGRNAMTWDRKFEYDLEYIRSGITFWGDLKIVCRTFVRVLRRDGISAEGMDTAEDLGDSLLAAGRVDRAEYEQKLAEAEKLTAAAAKK